MQKNIGSVDKAIRMLVAIIIAVLYFTHVISGTVAMVLLIVAGVFILTALMNFCPLYRLFGVKTCKRKG